MVDISGKVGKWHLFSLIKSSNELQGAVLTPRQLVERCGWAPAVEPDRSSRWWRVFPRSFGSCLYGFETGTLGNQVEMKDLLDVYCDFLLPPFTVCELS